MKITENASLQAYNTFGIDVSAKFLIEIESPDDVIEALQFTKKNSLPILTLGGGSNILFTQSFDGAILLIRNNGINIIDENDDFVWVEVGAGENWHSFVLYCVEKSWQGIENLSLIPGTVGAAPVQNIGAYGVEVKDLIESVEAVRIEEENIQVFTNLECEFAYRNSIFKTDLKGKCIITKVLFKLRKKPVFNTSYGAITSFLEDKEVTIKSISDAVTAIRQSKLPDPAEIGNCGSFFKNPIVEEHTFERVKKEYPNVAAYPQRDKMKLAAGWLIDQAGWKGKRIGDVGTYPKQALVMVNYGKATGLEAKEFAEKIQDVVFNKFGVKIEPEVNIL